MPQAIDKAFVPDICKASKGKRFDEAVLNQVILGLHAVPGSVLWPLGLGLLHGCDAHYNDTYVSHSA